MEGRPALDLSALTALPYDLLLAISQHLAYQDVLALTLSCRSLRDFIASRPVYRHLAQTFLRRCRPLPLTGFTRLSDLSNESLIAAIHKAARLEQAWLTRTPRPAPKLPPKAPSLDPRWYRTLRSPPGEEVDWLSPITSSYILCSTKSGKVFCWDIESDRCLAVWDPQAQWELWKCRVEFDAREVYFTMAKVLDGSTSYETRRMEFVVMRLYFPPPDPTLDITPTPTFSALASFNTYGAVMNVFLLDPTERVLSAFIWMAGSNTIGLYALLDWDVREYVFIDTGIFCSQTGNWSCILYANQIVIHTEDSDAAEQFLYPLPLLREYARPAPASAPPFSSPARTDKRALDDAFMPALTARLEAPVRCKRSFVFPPRAHANGAPSEGASTTGASRGSSPNGTDAAPAPADDADDAHAHEPADGAPGGADGDDAPPAGVPFHPDNPYNWPWYPDSCHFVRQWWPTLPNPGARMRRVSCTVVLLARHDAVTHQTAYVLAQHYFGTPLGTDRAAAAAAAARDAGEGPPPPRWTAAEKGKARELCDADGIPMRMWYVREPFEVVSVADPPPAGLGGNAVEEELEKERPLMAVDFGHAVWIEYADEPGGGGGDPGSDDGGSDGGDSETETLADGRAALEEDGDGESDGEDDPPERVRPKRLRFVSFPPIVVGEDGHEIGSQERVCFGAVRTLGLPPELDLHSADTINIDQSQGAVIVSVKEGRIFVLYYE